jgi:hypothetical protein
VVAQQPVIRGGSNKSNNLGLGTMRECIGAATTLRHADDTGRASPHQARSSLTCRGNKFYRLLLLSVSMAAISALVPRSAAAQNWTGATSNDWTVGSNWNTGTVPAGGAVIIGTQSDVVLGVASGATATTGNIRVGSTT